MLLAQTATQANRIVTLPTASVNTAATSPEITCRPFTLALDLLLLYQHNNWRAKQIAMLFNIFYPLRLAIFTGPLLCEFCEKNINEGNVLAL
ncbi:MAG TPA: hypothetical protein VN633_22800 [Bryobacteraceae bacterium]|nr:hypothetical protein [Bryobacteraceae bacterium]